MNPRKMALQCAMGSGKNPVEAKDISGRSDRQAGCVGTEHGTGRSEAYEVVSKMQKGHSIYTGLMGKHDRARTGAVR